MTPVIDGIRYLQTHTPHIATMTASAAIAGLIFHAPLTSDLVLLVGTGSATFARATAQSYNDTGVVKAVTSGNPAFEKDGSGTDLGLSMWEANTNDCVRSENFGHAAWSKTNITVASNDSGSILDGASADKLTADAANGTIIQNLGIIGSTATSFSIYVKRVTGTGNIELTLDGGTGWTDISGEINSSTFTRVDMAQTLANPDVGIRIVTSGDEILVDGAQSEGSLAWGNAGVTPYIPTTNGAVTRNKTELTYPVTNNIEVADGTIHMKIRLDQYSSTAEYFFFDSRNGQPGMIVYKRDGGASGYSYTQGAGVIGDAGTINADTVYSLAVTWLVDDFESYVDGSSVGTDTAGAVSTGHSTILLGWNVSGSGHINGNIQDVQIYDHDLTDGEISSLAA